MSNENMRFITVVCQLRIKGSILKAHLSHDEGLHSKFNALCMAE